MPVGESFWNPYRWVTVCNRPISRQPPKYQHTLSGLSGRISCELEALTPLVISDGRGYFVHHHDWRPFIPGTSLKGAVRSLAEVVGNAAVPSTKDSVDAGHSAEQAHANGPAGAEYDVLARTFGYLNDGGVFSGMIRFSDARIVSEVTVDASQWRKINVAVGQPKPTHGPFYPGNDRRKFYHHQPATQQLRHADVDQTRCVRPAPPGSKFAFSVDFVNLADSELNLVLYCLALEDDVTVTLSRAASGRAEEVSFQGGLRHKLGGAKPHGAGSVHIRITGMQLTHDPRSRYTGVNRIRTWDQQSVTQEIDRRTRSYRHRTDITMKELRAMLIYSGCDPRMPIRYPDYEWFRDQRNRGLATPLKPTV